MGGQRTQVLVIQQRKNTQLGYLTYGSRQDDLRWFTNETWWFSIATLNNPKVNVSYMFKLWTPGAFCSVPYFSLHVRSNCQRPERLVNGWWFLIPKYPTYIKLVGCIPTPLKNMSSSVGMIIPNIWKHKIHVPNHQPERVAEFSVDIDQTGFLRWDSRWKHQGRWPLGPSYELRYSQFSVV